MYFALDPDRRRMQEKLRAWVAENAAPARVRTRMRTGEYVDAEQWRHLGTQLAAVGRGGTCTDAGRGGVVDAVAALEVLGAALYPGPCLGTTVAAAVLAGLAPGDPAAADRARLAAGELWLSPAWPRTDADRLEATPMADGAELDGEIGPVVDAVAAPRYLLSDGRDWYDVPAGAAGLEVTPVRGLDQSRNLARLRLRATPARRVSTRERGADLLERAVVVERIAVAAENLAVARHCLDAGIAYARERHQFGRPIGSFQALQHWFADVALAVECAWSATYQAAWDVDRGRVDESRAASLLAAATAGDAASAAAEQLMQVSGGIGFTWDDPAHLYLKRAKSNRLLFGHPDTARERLGDLLGV